MPKIHKLTITIPALLKYSRALCVETFTQNYRIKSVQRLSQFIET